MTQTALSDHIEEILPAYVNGTLDAARAGAAQEHVGTCATCAAELSEWEAIGGAAQTAAARLPAPSRGLLDRALLKIEQPEPGQRPQRRPRSWRRTLVARRPMFGFGGPLSAGMLAAALTGIMLLTLVGAYAEGALTIFEPKELVAVPVSLQDLGNLPNFDQFGTASFTPLQPPQSAPDAVAAGAAAGMTVLTPGSLPASVPSAATYTVVPSQNASFTFDAGKARAAAASGGKPLPAMPAKIAGSTLQITTGAAVIALYGGPPGGLTGGVEATTSESGAAGSGTRESLKLGGVPKLLVAQARAPTVSSNGATADELESYLLSQPGISPQLASQIRAIRDPSKTWPIPIPVGQAGSHSVTVQGSKGLAIADSTGLGGGILWEKDGIIYAVGGVLTEKELLSIANALH